MIELVSPLHISHSAASRDGGIAIAIAQLLEEQQNIGLFSRWLTADQYSSWSRDHDIYQATSQIESDLLHCHGLWRSPTRMVAHWHGERKPLIISPHGMLDSWAMACAR